jgi:hypothetical protein
VAANVGRGPDIILGWYDDALDVVGVHLVGGIVGSLLSYGAHLFLDPKQLFDPEVYSGTTTLRERIGGWVEKSFLAALATTVYLLVVREDEADTALHREKMDRLSLEREMTEAQLQVMQAQIEPQTSPFLSSARRTCAGLMCDGSSTGISTFSRSRGRRPDPRR